MKDGKYYRNMCKKFSISIKLSTLDDKINNNNNYKLNFKIILLIMKKI